MMQSNDLFTRINGSKSQILSIERLTKSLTALQTLTQNHGFEMTLQTLQTNTFVYLKKTRQALYTFW